MKKLKKLSLKKETISDLSKSHLSQIQGGYQSGLPFSCAICTNGICETYTCPDDTYACTTDPYQTQCCSADLEICNTNSAPYCTAC
jgi:natural product precursor